MIVAAMTCKNEADIIGATITHLLDQGVDRILVADGMSTDGTRDILATLPVTVVDDPAPYHHQPALVTALARRAQAEGATWVLAVDADEYWCACNGDTIAETLRSLPTTAQKLYARMYQHQDLDHRELEPKPLPKVAFRPAPWVEVANGNHEVNIDGGVWGILEVREVQYRGFEHFRRKIMERNATIDPALPLSDGEHHRRYAGWTVEQLEREWAVMQARPTVFDPIPTKVTR